MESKSDREDTVFQIWDRWGPPYDGGEGVPPDVNSEDLKGSPMRFPNYPMRTGAWCQIFGNTRLVLNPMCSKIIYKHKDLCQQ